MGKSKVIKWLALFLILPIVAILFYFGWWYGRSLLAERQIKTSKQQGATDIVLSPPTELSTGFDPSVNAGVYRVAGVDQASGKVNLIYEFPKNKKGEAISPTLTCPLWDSKVFDLGAKVPRYLSSEAMMEVMDSTSKAQLLLFGKCSDKTCEAIDRGCTLKVIQARQNEDI